jgi:hypothetical protein
VPLSQVVTEEMTLRYTAMIEDVTDLLVITRSGIQANVAATDALRDYWIATVDMQMALVAGGPSRARPALLPLLLLLPRAAGPPTELMTVLSRRTRARKSRYPGAVS